MITDFFKLIWKYFDVLCFLAAIIFAVWGCFLLSFTAGIFSIAVSLVIIGYLSEKIANLQ
ncbi:DUF1056 family protein [Limosilactobacillus reuteri]|uniref:DUF1056 family protein n=1 Tax=Limosilactobacillus reuteri TaxID=1598 RepID=A0A256VAK2_LIMRT|nr:DUF1056 family protein [Limosilactobacillus reuteri]MBV0920975.1 DUF1056 family protein [Limosilactobacillus reuteri]MCT3208513.1 DUF1056 family protein [Limosilactobacillus reuteri]MCT3216280.1 DUF1056 family protein [Limosilactobacillus reuteri]NFB10414.1 DUF1056 family protein [Limosilactobacillus reuteri]OYS87814.1 hypothetical protein CBG19_03770 [Limosilactobacillus reuteri]